MSKRKRENGTAIEVFPLLELDAKKRRVLPDEVLYTSDDMGESGVDCAILMRKHLVSLHQGLQAQWNCVCRRCSGLGMRLSLPQRKKKSQMETTFDAFFGIQSQSEVTFHEAKITVK